jgi:hypothetical protein
MYGVTERSAQRAQVCWPAKVPREATVRGIDA